MGYYISYMIGIRDGGVFSSPKDVEKFKGKLKDIIEDIYGENERYWFDPDYSMTEKELIGYKGSYIVIAGVSNGWSWDSGYWDEGVSLSDFAKRLSTEFGTEVMAMTWDEQTNKIESDVFLNGKAVNEVYEHPISQSLRRIAS